MTVRRAAGVVVDSEGVWLTRRADGRLAAVYSASFAGDDEDAYDDRWSSLHDALGNPNAVGRIVATLRPDGHPEDEVDVYLVTVDEFSAASSSMVRVDVDRIREHLDGVSITDPVAVVGLQAVLLDQASTPAHPRTIWIGEDIDLDGYRGTFSATWEGPAGHGAGPQHGSLDEVVDWARALSSRVVVRVGEQLYSLPHEPVVIGGELLPEWHGSAPTRRRFPSAS